MGLTDLEIIKKCAERMGIEVSQDDVGGDIWIGYMTEYNPLHDDAQAMALVKNFGIAIDRHNEGQHLIWMASINCNPRSYAEHPDDLNRAISECVAKLSGAV